jgi:hypothetical protein
LGKTVKPALKNQKPAGHIFPNPAKIPKIKYW